MTQHEYERAASRCSNSPKKRTEGLVRLVQIWWSSKDIHVFAKGLQWKLAHFLHAVHEHIVPHATAM